MARPMTEWIGTGEAARRLGYTWPTLLTRIKDGRVTALFVAGRYLLDPDSVEDLRIQEEAGRGVTA